MLTYKSATARKHFSYILVRTGRILHLQLLFLSRLSWRQQGFYGNRPSKDIKRRSIVCRHDQIFLPSFCSRSIGNRCNLESAHVDTRPKQCDSFDWFPRRIERFETTTLATRWPGLTR